MANRTDPITVELIRNALASINDQGALALIRTSRSTIVRDGMDFSCCLFDSEGQMIAEGLGNPGQNIMLAHVMPFLLKKFGGSLARGDIILSNDPYQGGSHLPDIMVVKPILYKGVLVGFSGILAHVTDVGGRVPGGNAADSTEIFQEGLRLPLLKLSDRGVRNNAVMEIVRANVRVPQEVIPDIESMIEVCTVGERGFLELIERYGVETVQKSIKELVDSTERVVREEISKWPKGTYVAEDYVEDPLSPEPIVVRVTLRVEGDSLSFDLTGTSKQVKTALNYPVGCVDGVFHTAVQVALGFQTPLNAGLFRAITVFAPPGTVVNPQMPAAVAARGVVGHTLRDAALAVCHQVVPGRIFAARGDLCGISIGGSNSDSAPYVYQEFLCSGWGGRPTKDGVEGTSPLGTNLCNIPAEVVETRYPILVEERAFVPDTGGPGKFRGTRAFAQQFRLTAEEATLFLRSGRHKFLPYGLAGGKPGTPTSFTLNPGKNPEVLPALVVRRIQNGDVVRQVMAGGGGYGDPLNRDPSAVLEDVRAQKMTREYVEREYGVVIDSAKMEVDMEATEHLRAKYTGS